MKITRLLSIISILFLSNIVLIINQLQNYFILCAIVIVLSFIFFVSYNVNPRFKRKNIKRLEVLIGGRELIINADIVVILDICLHIYFFTKTEFALPIIITNMIFTLIVLYIMLFNGTIRFISISTQISVIMRAILFFTWWIPVANFFIFLHCCRVAKREYLFAMAKDELNESRKDSDVCKTKYPLLLVHGIFWRDWQLFNYWGRIPKELIRNGATIFYGNQQSAAPMIICATELKNQILSIVEKENCGKVNIIAHSKGGLDARYVISSLGMDEYVASLTTIGTPHGGSSLVDKILSKVPDSVVNIVAKRYNSIYKKLGDTEPDFYSGVCDLTTEQCTQFNETVVNKENVIYQSYASKMSGFFSASFPLNIGYAMLKRMDGENDGFVSVESSKWSDYLGSFKTNRNRGVSHGDMIDLMRKNIHGFDVCECYVSLVKKLKSMGL